MHRLRVPPPESEVGHGEDMYIDDPGAGVYIGYCYSLSVLLACLLKPLPVIFSFLLPLSLHHPLPGWGLSPVVPQAHGGEKRTSTWPGCSYAAARTYYVERHRNKLHGTQ